MDFYDRQHWEALIGTIIDRVGVEAFIEHATYALEQRGFARLAEEVRQAIAKLAVVDADG